jgi:peptide/nickel transport system permease protein
MLTFWLRRLALTLLTLFTVSMVVFALSELAPGNIARNTLGVTITPDQERSFNAQNGLDQPALARYVRWMIGSDWQARRLIGRPVTRLRDAATGRADWWEVGAGGTFYQHYSIDGETLIRIVRAADGTRHEETLGPEAWHADVDGALVFWGVDRAGHAAKWIKGRNIVELTPTDAGWISVPGAPVEYLPLQRGILRGDPGVSFLTRRPVAETLVTRVRNTALLAVLAFVFIMPLALGLGLLAGLNEGKLLDRVLSVFGLVTTATPEFVNGVFLILIFSTWLGWLPGAVVLSSDTAIFENPRMLVLPILTLTLVELGYVLRITRASMLEVMRTNYIRTAILKGLPYGRVVFRHALRNALLAPITVILLHVNWLVGGIVIVESIFGYPGLGSFILQTALFKDVFGLEAATMLLVVLAVATQLLADVLYTFLNPRIRYG